MYEAVLIALFTIVLPIGGTALLLLFCYGVFCWVRAGVRGALALSRPAPASVTASGRPAAP